MTAKPLTATWITHLQAIAASASSTAPIPRPDARWTR